MKTETVKAVDHIDKERFINDLFVMQRSSLNRIVFFSLLVLSLFIVSCSSKVTKLHRVQHDSYLSPKYENKSFIDAAMDICYPFIDVENIPPYADSAQALTMKDFYEAFVKYFPQGIKTFSSVTLTEWIFFEMRYPDEIIEYQAKTEDSLDFYISLPDSLSYFQSQSNADFLFILHFAAFTLNQPDSSNPESKYATIIDLEYTIWDRISGDLVAQDKVSAKMEFDRLSGSWPYRGAVMKTAALIFEKLPMFEK